MIYSYVISLFIFGGYFHWITVTASTGSLAKEFCPPDSVHSDSDAQAIITTVLAIRDSILVPDGQKTHRKNNPPANNESRRKSKEEDTNSDVSPGRRKKACGSVTQQGLQQLLAIDWVINILNFKSENVFGVPVNESFVPGVKLGYRSYDTCGLESLPISQLIEAYADFYAPPKTCIFNVTSINAGAIVGELRGDDLLDAAAYMKRYSQPLVAQSYLPESLAEDVKFGNVFSTLPSISMKAQAMSRLARQLGWTQVAVLYEDNSYGVEGKNALFKAAKDHELCISNAHKIPALNGDIIHGSTVKNQMEPVIAQLVSNLPHAPAVLVFASEASSVEFLQVSMNSTHASQVAKLHWVLSDFIKESSRFAGMFPAKGLFSLAPDSPSDVPEFRDYWKNTNVDESNNAWMKEYYQQAVGCKFPDETNPIFSSLPFCPSSRKFALGEVDPDISINPDLISMIDGVYAFAVSLRKSWEIKCKNRPGLCPQLVQMSHEEYLDIVSNTEFKYEPALRSPPSLVGRMVNFRSPTADSLAVYELIERDGQLLFMEAYTYQGNRLQQTGQPIFYHSDGTVNTDPPLSTCPGGSDDPGSCACSNSNPRAKNTPIYKQGDLMLIGMFPIHSSSDESAATCGQIRQRDGYQLAESFWYALEKVNDKKSTAFSSILKGIRLGSIALDSCNSPPRAAHLASGLLINANLLMDSAGVETASQKDLTNHLIGLVGDLNDHTSTELASILRFNALTQISYGAKTAALGDFQAYPSLLRTVVSDSTRLNMTFSALRQMSWDYVQIVSSESSYGRIMSKIFRTQALEHRICIGQNLIMTTNMSNLADVVEGMRNKSKANAVILFLEKRQIRGLLEYLERFYASQSAVRYALIAPDHWYNDPELLNGVESAAEGSLAFAARRLANQQFQKFINARTIQENEGNPWLVEYMESSLHCNFPGSGTRQYAAACNPNANLGQIPGFRVDLASNDVVNSVYAMAFGLDAMLKDYCGKAYQGVCAEFKTLANRNALLYEYVKKASFEDETGRIFAFSDQRDAATPVAVLHVRKNNDGGTGLQYAQAGVYSPLEAATKPSFIQAATVRSLRERTTSNCLSNAGNCAECTFFNIQSTSTTESTTSSSTSTSTTTTTALAPHSRNDRHSKISNVPKGYYTRDFLYTPSSDKILMGAVFPIHGPGIDKTPFQCGHFTEEGVFMVEAFLWAIDAMNANSEAVKFQSGALVLDSCSHTGQAYDDLKDLYTKPTGYFMYNGTDTIDPEDIIAFVNDPTEDGTHSLASELLDALNITNFGIGPLESVSYDDVSDQTYLLHTTSPMKIQNSAILSFLHHMNWTYASILYSGHRWGVQAYFRFKSEALDRGICFAVEDSVRSTDPESKLESMIQNFVSKLDGSHVVILMLDMDETSVFLKSISKAMTKGQLNQENRLIFIGTSTWGDRVPFREGEEQAALGSFVFQHDTQIVDGFRTYMESLRYENNDRNPWWREYWQRKFNCGDDEDACSKFALTENDFRNEAMYTNIMNAVWSASVGLNNLCTSGKRQETCVGVQKSKDFKRQLLESILNGGFARVDNPQENFKFTRKGWSDSGFYLLNLINDDAGSLEYRAVGKYTDQEGLAFTDTLYGYDKSNNRIALTEFKSRCTDPKACPQCVKIQWTQELTTTPAPELTTTKLELSTVVTTVLPTYGVQLSNATYTDAFLYAPASADSYLIVVTFPVHARGVRPLSCGRLRLEHYQNLQAFLWALRSVRADNQLLPGAKLSALVFDTCSDPTKAVRDLSNFLSEQVIFRTASGEKIDSARTLAVLNSPYTDEALPISELLSSYGIPNISPGMSASMLTLADAYKSDMSLRTSVPTDVQARAMAAILTRINWTSISILYTDNIWGTNGRADFRTEANHRDICIVISEPIPESDDSNCTDHAPKIDETIARLLAAKASAGIRGIVAWMTERSLHCFLHGVRRSIDRDQMKSGDFTLILPADIADIHASIVDEFEKEAVGLVALQYAASVVEPFRDYWQTLPASDDVAGHFWSKEFQERSPTQNVYHQNAYLLNTVNSVFSIAVGLEQLRRHICTDASESEGLCKKLISNPQFRKHLLESIRKVEFDDVTGKRFQFVHNSFGNEALAIANLVRKEKGSELRMIGYYESEILKLRFPPQGFDSTNQSTFHLRDRPSACNSGESRICSICTSKSAQSYPNTESIETTTPIMTASTVPPTSTDLKPSTIDPWRILAEQLQRNQSINPATVAESPIPPGSPAPAVPVAPILVGSARLARDLIVLPASKHFTLIGLFPVHKRGQTALSCEGFNSMSGFQRLAAFLYAVNEVNRDPYLLPGMELGAVALDDCSSEERALADVFEFLSSPDAPVRVDDLVAAIGFDYANGAANADRLFRTLRVPIVNSGPTPYALKDEPLTLATVPGDDIYAKIVADVFKQMKWTYFSLLYESGSVHEPTAKYFERLLTANRPGCTAKSVALKSQASLEDAQLAVRQLVLATGSKSVAVFLSDRNTLQILKAVVAERVPIGRFVFITKFNDDWIQDADFLVPLQRFGQGLLTIEIQRRNSTNFSNFLSSLTLKQHAPFPTHWFQDFWQQTFQCVLRDSTVPRQQFTNPCTGEERLTHENFVQGGAVLPTILAVHTAARGLHRFLMQNCPSRTADTLDSCMSTSPLQFENTDPRSHLMKSMRSANFTYSYEPNKDPIYVNFGSSNYLDAEYSVRNLIRHSDDDFRAQEVGVWRPVTGLILDHTQIQLYDARGERKIPTSACVGEYCAMQCAQQNGAMMNSSSASESRPTPGQGPSASLYFNSVWGIVVAAVAGLGMLTCVVCIIYFLVTFPISHGTTVLGYMILFGLIVLYGLAFAYVVAPTAFSCSVRRFCTGICWAFVFAPMLIKVMYAWHTRSNADKPQARLENPSSPCALFSLTLGVVCVQIVIAIEWVILQAPDGVVYLTTFKGEPVSTSSGGVWRCNPGEQFETVVLISTVYVMFLLFLTTIFSLLTWNVDEHNRESRWICLACMWSIGVWLAWGFLATRHEYRIRDPAIAIGIVVDATVILLCLYLRKAYLYSKYRREAKEVMFDTHSAVYLTSTLASGGQFTVDTNGGGFYDGKIIAATNGGHYMGPKNGQIPIANPRRLPAQTPSTTTTGLSLNGRRTNGDTRTTTYPNAAFEGNGQNGCEFQPGSRISVPNGLALYNGKRNGSLAPSTPTSHRF